MKRWTATLWYLTDAGIIDVVQNIEELEELQEVVERGPDWRTLDRIEITLARTNAPRLTIEQSLAEGRHRQTPPTLRSSGQQRKEPNIQRESRYHHD